MIAAVQTVDGVLLVDVEEELVLGPGTELPETDAPHVDLPNVVATAGSGSTVVAVLERRPPLAISHDGGRTWSEAGGGLPPGFAIAVADDDPDRMLYAARNRLYVSANGGSLLAFARAGAAGHRRRRLDRLSERAHLVVGAQAVHVEVRILRQTRRVLAPVVKAPLQRRPDQPSDLLTPAGFQVAVPQLDPVPSPHV